MNFRDDENEITGSWLFRDGQMVGDEAEQRINRLVLYELTKVGIGGGGWEVLYHDPSDGRYWERTFPRSEMQGGGPQTLRLLDQDEARRKYRIVAE